MKLNDFIHQIETGIANGEPHRLGKPLGEQALRKWQASHKKLDLPEDLLSLYRRHDGIEIANKEMTLTPLGKTRSFRPWAVSLWGDIPGEDENPLLPRAGLVLGMDSNNDWHIVFDSRAKRYFSLSHEGDGYVIGPELDDLLDWLAMFAAGQLDQIRARFERKYPPPPVTKPPGEAALDDIVAPGVTVRAVEQGAVKYEDLSDEALDLLEKLRPRRQLESDRLLGEIAVERSRRVLPDKPPVDGPFQEVNAVQCKKDHWYRAAFGPGGQTLIVAETPHGLEGTTLLRFLDVPSLRCVREVSLPPTRDLRLCVDATGEAYYLTDRHREDIPELAGPGESYSPFVCRHDFKTDKLLQTYPISGSAYVTDLSISPDGTRLAFSEHGYAEKPCRLFDIKSGKLVSDFIKQQIGLWIGFSPLGTHIVTGDYNGNRLYDSEGNFIVKLRAAPRVDDAGVQFLSNGQILVPGRSNNTHCCLSFYDPATGKRQSTVQTGGYLLEAVLPGDRLLLNDHFNGGTRIMASDAKAILHEQRMRVEYLPKYISPDGNWGLSDVHEGAMHLFRFPA